MRATDYTVGYRVSYTLYVFQIVVYRASYTQPDDLQLVYTLVSKLCLEIIKKGHIMANINPLEIKRGAR